MNQRLAEFLASRQVAYEHITHEAAATAQEQAAAIGVTGHRVVKVLVVKARDGFVMAAIPASTELDLDRLKGLIGRGEIRLATREELRDVVPDCAPGTIPPFGGLYGLRTFVDQRLLTEPEVAMPAGELGSAVRMSSTEFRRVLDAQVGDFAVPEALVAAGGVARPRRQAGRRRRRT